MQKCKKNTKKVQQFKRYILQKSTNNYCRQEVRAENVVEKTRSSGT